MQYAQEHVDRGTDRIGLQVYPEPPTADILAVLWPAMGVPAGYYRPFATQLADQGLAVVVADLRGTATSTPRPGRASRYGYAELADDVGAVLDALKPQRDGRRTVLIGHSLGGQVSTLHLAACAANGTEPGVNGLVLLAVGLPYWRIYPDREKLRILALTQGIAAATRSLGVWPGWGFGGRQAAGVIRDWARTARTGRYPALNGLDVEAALAEVTTPVLAIDMEGDRYTPAATVDRLTGKLRSAPVVRDTYATREAGAPIDHFRWVRAGAALAARVARWAKAG